jgi:tetratricopeptide (TPR) repeat protein
MVPSAFRLAICWCVPFFLFPAFGIAQEPDPTRFDLAFAEGIWSFSQGSDLDAVEYFAEASRLKPQDGFSRYMLGLSYLRVGKPREAAAEIAASLKAKEPPPVEHSRVLVDLGASQLAAGDVKFSISTLEEALRDRQTDAVAFHYYAKALALDGQREAAEAALARARLLDPKLDPKDLPVTFPQVMAQAPASGEGPRWQGNAGFLAGYDSNPNLLSRDLFLPNPSSETELVSGAQSDSVASADLRLTYEPHQLPDGWSLAVDLRGGGSFHKDFSYLNLVRSGAVIQLAHGDDPRGFLEGPLGAKRVNSGPASRYSLLLQGGVDELRLDGASYLRVLAAAGSWLLSPSELNATQVDLHVQDLNYFHHRLADPRRSGTEVGVAVRQIRFRDRPRNSFMAVGIFAGQRNAGNAFDRTSLGGDFEMALPLSPRWQLDWTVAAGREDFEHNESDLFVSAEPARKRKDTTWGGSATLAFDIITDRLRLLVRGVYQRRDSNLTFGDGLPALDYRRTLVETGLSWSF